jgi:hypothetical protein
MENKKVLVLEKSDGGTWSLDEIHAIAAMVGGVERLSSKPDRIVIVGKHSLDKIQTALGHSDFTEREVGHHEKWS